LAKRKKLPEPKRFAIYARVSSDEQAKKENSSIEAQISIATQYIETRMES